MWRRHPSELRADLQREYGVCWDDVLSGRVAAGHAAALAACLPPGSLCLAREDERLGWTREQWLLLAVANSLREEPIDPFARPDRMAMEADELGDYLSRPRVAVSESEAHAHGRQSG